MLGLFFVSVEVMYITMVILCTPGIPGDVHAMEAITSVGTCDLQTGPHLSRLEEVILSFCLSTS